MRKYIFNSAVAGLLRVTHNVLLDVGACCQPHTCYV